MNIKGSQYQSALRIANFLSYENMYTETVNAKQTYVRQQHKKIYIWLQIYSINYSICLVCMLKNMQVYGKYSLWVLNDLKQK